MATVTGSQRILLVDDDEALQQMYTLILTKAGFAVTGASDGIEGLGKAREGGFHLILLDLMMPNLDGIGVLKGLLEEPPKRQNGPVVVLSNAGYDAVAKEAEGLGANGFLMKADLLPKDLVEKVKQYMTPERPERGRPAVFG